MKTILFIIGSFFIWTPLVAQQNKLLAFPGAQGGAAHITGGRGGEVLYVTSLADTGEEGTLRWAVSRSGPRTVLFKVAGIIELESNLAIEEGNITLAGQTAPGDGICIKNHPVIVRADNVIIQFMRFRMGEEKGVEDDALRGFRCKDVLIDHCSMSWSTDECSSFYDMDNLTMQWCILSESLRNSVHEKGKHGYGGIWGGRNATFHHNLLAHHDSRNPRFCGSRYSNEPQRERVDFCNNVIYNWGINSGYAGEGGTYNIISNYYKPGPATRPGEISFRIFSPNGDDGTNKQPKGVWGHFYVDGNYMEGNEAVTRDNWLGIHPRLAPGDNPGKKEEIKARQPFELIHFVPESAQEAYVNVLLKAGASLIRDEVDKRIVREVSTGTYTYTGSRGSNHGFIDSAQDVGGWPEYTYIYNNVSPDSDGDGIPDKWEDQNGLDKNNPSDARQCSGEQHYTNLERYLQSLVSHLY